MQLDVHGHARLCRQLLGVYVAAHFALLLPHAAELFSNTGMLGDGSLSPLLHAFPNLLAFEDGPVFVQLFVGFGALCGLALAVDRWPSLAALGAYYVWACLFGRNPLIANPSLPYVGLLLLATAWAGEDLRQGLPTRLRALLWASMGFGYSYSGLTKLVSASWVDGTALQRVLDSPLSRDWPPVDALLALPSPVLVAATWGALLLEVSFAVLCWSARLRPWLWAGMTAMHLGLLLTVNFADLTLGMLLLHAFTFDPAWLDRRAHAPDRGRPPQHGGATTPLHTTTGAT